MNASPLAHDLYVHEEVDQMELQDEYLVSEFICAPRLLAFALTSH